MHSALCRLVAPFLILSLLSSSAFSKNMSSISLLLALIVSLSAAQNINTCPGNLESLGWCDCSPANSGVIITEFNFSPDPIRRGQNVTGVISGTDKLSSPITGGSMSVLVEYLDIPLVNMTFSICDALASAHAKVPEVPQCPVTPGPISKTGFTLAIPGSFPPGDYSGRASAVDQTSRVIQCVQFKMKIA